MRILTLTACAISIIFVGGCIYVPPVWDVHDQIYRVKDIEEGVTTKHDVLEKFDEPAFRDEDLNMFTYLGKKSAGFLVIAAGYTASAGLIGEEAWWVNIYFDENDVVGYFTTSDMNPEFLTEVKAQYLKTRAEKGNADAQFQMYKRSSSDSEGWRWLCLAANQGHALAQEELGDLNAQYRKNDWRIERSVRPSGIKAYVWYSLAASNGLQRAAFLRDQVSKDMTDQEVAEAERLFAEWEPNPAECELEMQADN